MVPALMRMVTVCKFLFWAPSLGSRRSLASPNLLIRVSSYWNFMDAYRSASRKLKKINQYFGSGTKLRDAEYEAPVVTEEKAPSAYNFADYRTFKNLGNFFKELITPLEFKTDREGIYSASMTNPGSSRNQDFYLNGSPIFIIDGFVTKDVDFAARVPFHNVETVELFYDPPQLDRMYKVMGLSGAVRVKTNLPDFQLPEGEQDDIIQLNGLRDNVGAVTFGQAKGRQRALPNLSSQIYWNPGLKTDDTGMTSFRIAATDDRSSYLLTILGITDRNEVGYLTYELKLN